MLPLVAFPELVQHFAPFFFDGVFSDAAFIEFQRYISGLIISENKTVDGMNRLFVHESRNQSSLNRLLTQSLFSLDTLNQRRLSLLASLPGTRLKARGVLSVDGALLTHYGEHFEHIANLYDPLDKRFVWAHNLVSLHYSDDDTDYPVFFRLWQPADLTKMEQGLLAAGVKLKDEKRALQESEPRKWRNYIIGVWRRNWKKAGVAELYDSKLQMAEQFVQQWVAAYPDLKLPVTFDNWYTQPAFCHFLDGLGLPYVGTLADEDQVRLKTGMERLDSFAAGLKEEHRTALERGQQPVFRPIGIKYKGEREQYYSFRATLHVHKFGKQRVVINHRVPDLSDRPKFLMSNRLIWQAAGITRIRRHRWPVEVYHEEGKEEGLDKYQLRDFAGIERHVALVAVVYSLLRAAPHDPVLRGKRQRDLKFVLEGGVPSWCRATQAHSLWGLALFISAGLTQGETLHQIMAPVLRTKCRG